ncbi:MAG: DNA-binding protein [Candidatus Harrisonbacteria bacterium CG10_big_fil_rev_8_21_14_0_10_42_17]|uniref:DNA-binding protein n=1 Tax=Candidatus Harrisonbacteria bacterium CG10_big_fil_rev_8_21_14_0_10_42_17 TaxID=1974584 RepID=A0A2M6WH10_9BACT|nr:MAG: DNA-binding protein [Candidatus Harrisonbacteria bacterium CG10_big_fil_rev_8_21_14_0_10_42_17]
MDIPKRFGDNLKRIRLEKDMSQTDLAEKIGADKGYVSLLENGKKNPTLVTFEKIAKALGVSTDDLLK